MLEIYHNFQKYNSLIYVRREKRLSKRYKKNLPKNKINFIYKKFSYNCKKRFVDSISQSKVIGTYNLNDEILDKNELIFNKILNKQIKRYDLIIVSDYGHD